MSKTNIYILAIKRKGKKGERVTLHQRIYYKGEQWQIALGISVPSEDYDKDNEIVLRGDDHEIYNRVISTSKQTLKDILLRFELIEHRAPTLQEIQNEYLKRMVGEGFLHVQGNAQGNAQGNKLQDRIEEFIREQSREKLWSLNTSRIFESLKKHLEQYPMQIRFKDLSDRYLYGLIDYWAKSLHFNNTSTHKYLKALRWYLRWCYRKGFYEGKLHDTFKPKLKGSDFNNKTIIYLTEEELNTLSNFVPEKGQEHLERVRDIFLFACYCGLRFSDVQRLKREDIANDAINIVTQKTGDKISINLNKHTRAVLAKYEEWSKVSGKCLPTISNHNTNDYLHELCKLCKIDTPTKQICYIGDKMVEVVQPKYELITFHAARRTFITHAVRLGIPIEVVMKFSGHHSPEMLKPYLKIVDELKKKEMTKFDQM